MRIKSNIKGLRGSILIHNRVLRLRGMDEKEINRRVHIIDYALKHGEKLAEEAFNVSTRTIRRWKKLLRESRGQLQTLSPKSRRPNKFKSSLVRQEIRDAILELRKKPGKLGKEKIFRILQKKFKKDIPSISTIGRIIYEFKKKGLLPMNGRLSLNGRTGKLHLKQRKKQIKIRKSKGEDVFQTDTIIRHFCNLKLYTLTGIDTKTKTAFAKCYLTHKSSKTKDFIDGCISKFPINKIQTDNGSEFAKHFKETLKENQIVHYHSYPRCPKMNANVERFNRTLSEDFLEKEKYTALTDLKLLNEKLDTYLSWYNNERPHKSLNYLTPSEYVLQLKREDICV
jgi:putative transposase